MLGGSVHRVDHQSDFCPPLHDCPRHGGTAHPLIVQELEVLLVAGRMIEQAREEVGRAAASTEVLLHNQIQYIGRVPLIDEMNRLATIDRDQECAEHPDGVTDRVGHERCPIGWRRRRSQAVRSLRRPSGANGSRPSGSTLCQMSNPRGRGARIDCDRRLQRVGGQRSLNADAAGRTASVEHDKLHARNVGHLLKIGQEVLVPEFRRSHVHPWDGTLSRMYAVSRLP